MYRLADYRAMIEDPVRTAAYTRAIERAVQPGSTVVEIGTGFGYFAVVACRAGARRVYALEPDAVVQLGPELARANGCEDRIEFIQNVSTRVTVEPADVLVSDLRGILPLLGGHIPTIVDARRRLLKPGGVQIPAGDTIHVALVSAAASSGTARGPEAVDLGPIDHAVSNLWCPTQLQPSDLLSQGAPWQTVDYRTVADAALEGAVELVAERDGCLRGIGAWFETELHDGIGFSTAPDGPPTVYGHGLFPIARPIQLVAGNRVRSRLRADLVGTEYVWSWKGRVLDGPSAGSTFSQSTFHAVPLSASRLRRRGDRFEPRLGRDGQAQAWILARMVASEPLGVIARGALEAFPDVFAGLADSLRRVADLSEQFSD